MNERGRRFFAYLIARAREPSTWAGVGVMLAALGLHLNSDVVQAIGFAGPALAGLLAALMPDQGP